MGCYQVYLSVDGKLCACSVSSEDYWALNKLNMDRFDSHGHSVPEVEEEIKRVVDEIVIAGRFEVLRG